MENDAEKKQGGKTWSIQAFKLILAGALICWVVRGIDFTQLNQIASGRILVFTALAGAVIGTQLILCAVRWRILLRIQQIEIPFSRALSLSMQGTFFSLCMPGGAVGGDVVKAAFLVKETQKGKRLHGVTSIFIDRVIGMLALFFLVAAAVTFAMKEVLTFQPEVKYPVLILYRLCLAGLAAGLALFLQDVIFRIPFARTCLDFIDRMAKGRITPVLDSVKACRKDPGRLFAAFLLSVLAMHPLLVAGLVLIVTGITGTTAHTGGTVLASLLGGTAAAIPVTPGGLGTRDKITQLVLETQGIDSTGAGFAALLYTLALVLVSMTGVFFFLFDSWIRKSGNIPENKSSKESEK